MKNPTRFLNRTICYVVLCFLLLFLTGCNKKDPVLENYKANMNQFFENIRVFDSSIDAIDQIGRAHV